MYQVVYEKYQRGDPLNDNELAGAAAHFYQLSEMLYKSGPVFRLAANEANRVYLALNGFMQARGIK